MVTLLLDTKLQVPPVRPELVPRPHLTRLLNDGLSRKLTLVSAPAGFGKTVLVCAWLKEVSRAHSWLSLDENDNDPARFFTYLTAALQRIDPNVGQAAQGMLQAPQPPASEALLTSLINDIAATPVSFVLVIDDYHLIHTQPIHELLASLVEHQPSQMHLVIATREEPPLPLSRLRARAQVTDVRQADLRFTLEEAAGFLRRTTNIDLAPEDVSALHARTEGWIAGLQLAALSLRGNTDVDGFVRSFAGSNRYILDYLMDEVFGQQSGNLREFLLKTSILDSYNAALCDSVAERSDSRDVLLYLEQANLFLVPLDESREWFRYHHLFADLLRHRLHLETAGDTAELHRRASRWFAEHGRAEEAVRHALAACAWDDAAELILCVSDQMLRRGEVITLLGWFQALPEEVVTGNSRLCLEFCWPLVLAEQIDAAEACLARAEAAALACEDPSLLGEIAVTKAYIARARGEGAQVIELSAQALSLLPPDEYALRSVVTVNLGMAQWFYGDLAAAEEALQEAEWASQVSGNEYARWMASLFLQRIEAARGKLHQAAEAWRRIVERAGQPAVACLAHYDLGRLWYEWNDLEAAADHVGMGIDLAVRSGLAEFEGGGCSVLAWVRQAQGETAAAQDALRRAEPLLAQPGVPPATRTYNLAHQVVVALGVGDLDGASRVADRFPASPQEAGSFPDFLLVLLARARLLLAQEQREAAGAALEKAHEMVSQAGWRYLAIQARALLAVAVPSPEEALAHLGEALALAEPEGYVRTFLDVGDSMAALLQLAVSRDIAPGYAAGLLAALGGAGGGPRRKIGPSPEGPRPSLLVEPLSDREIEVLRLLAGGSTYREIAQTLYLSINTVKTHVRNIYGKLGVARRRAAIARGRELELLP